ELHCGDVIGIEEALQRQWMRVATIQSGQARRRGLDAAGRQRRECTGAPFTAGVTEVRGRRDAQVAQDRAIVFNLPLNQLGRSRKAMAMSMQLQVDAARPERLRRR